MWVTNALEGTVSRVDPESGVVVQRIDVGRDPSGIAVGLGAVWVANSLDGTVSRIDPESNRLVQTVAVGVTPTALAVGAGAVWVTSSEERNVTKLDGRGRVLARIPTGALGRGIAVGGGGVWVTDHATRRVIRIDARRGRIVRTVSVGNGPTGIAFDGRSLWVANSLDGTVSQIDPVTERVVATISVGEGPDGVTAGSGAVWVAGEFSEAVVRIDPLESRVVEHIRVANRPKGLAFSDGRVWLAVQGSGAGHRGGRLIVEARGLIQGSIDPSYWSWEGTISSLSAAYDGLVSYARATGGGDGGRLVPNLALTLPEMAAGGTRYTFKLRPGISYSDGRVVRASDFRRALERATRGLLGQEVAVVGGETCPRACDLSRGVETDDASGTIVFRLQRPDGEFLRMLTLLAPIPRGTPDRDTGRRPLPSTGPYMVASYVPRLALTLVRNPRFRSWSSVARPDGFPDEIEFRLGGPRTGAVRAVEQRRIDVTAVSLDHVDEIHALESFRARFPSRYHASPEQAIVLVFLNVTRPPFNDVRVRRALNYAIDRSAISASYAQGYAQPTCQPRPPRTVGFRRYCPYTAAPSRTGEWKAPDLARARGLVAASGTRGMEVTVWTYPGFWEDAVHAGRFARSRSWAFGRASDVPPTSTTTSRRWPTKRHGECRLG